MEKNVKINLGCGIDLQPGFINVDLYDIKKLKECNGIFKNAKVKGKYVKADVRKLPFKDNYADYIIASEILEHIPLKDLKSTLIEWVRVLKKGGKMIITCPDFNASALEWLNTPFSPERYGDMAQVIFGSQLADGEYHHSPITPELLNFYLSQMGLTDGHIVKYNKGHKTIDYDGKPAKEGYVYRNGVVHAEVIK